MGCPLTQTSAQPVAPTIPLPRCCGASRVPGGLYLANGVVVSGGKPVWDFLLDPVTPVASMAKFQGIQELPNELYPPDFDRSTGIILVDMVSEHDYQVPDFVEETKRLGLSRRVQKTFPFERLSGRRGNIWLAMLHWKAQLTWSWNDPNMVTLRYKKCQWNDMGDARNDHAPDCIFHLWLDLWRNEVYPKQTRVMPGFKYAPLAVISDDQQAGVASSYFPGCTYGPAIFMVVPITHLEAVEYVPDGFDPDAAGMDVLLCAK